MLGASLGYFAPGAPAGVPTGGADGQVLTSDGAGGTAWEDAAGGGAVNTGSRYFNGTSDYLAITAGASPNLSLTGDFTIEAWVFVGNAVGDRVISSRWDAVDATKNHMFRYDGTSLLELLLWDSAGPFQVLYNSAAIRLETDSWNHVAVTFDATADTATFYVNGIAAGADTSAITTIQAGTAEFRLGAEGDGSDFWAGYMNVVRVWSDVRTASEINAGLYTVYGAATAGLVAEWSLNTDGADPISGYDLTATGTTAAALVPWRV